MINKVRLSVYRGLMVLEMVWASAGARNITGQSYNVDGGLITS